MKEMYFKKGGEKIISVSWLLCEMTLVTTTRAERINTLVIHLHDSDEPTY